MPEHKKVVAFAHFRPQCLRANAVDAAGLNAPRPWGVEGNRGGGIGTIIRTSAATLSKWPYQRDADKSRIFPLFVQFTDCAG